MIVFRPAEAEADPRVLLRALATRVSASPSTHASTVEWLIDAGVLESAITDVLSPERDGDHHLALLAGRATIAAADALLASWNGLPLTPAREALACVLLAMQSGRLPPHVTTRVPEGFAFYGLYPETYVEAARCFARERAPRDAVCIGLRSIGAPLSALVASTLRSHGCRVLRRTFRPRGRPWDRRIDLEPALSDRLRARRDAWFLVVDEGPGLSGTSMTATAATIAGLGIPDDRIVFFPSRLPDPAARASLWARERWARHSCYRGSFEDAWIRSGRLARSLDVGSLEDISAGRWRAVVFPDARGRPEVQPQFERRKFLARRGDEWLLAKFVGLGEHGRRKHERARRLADAGFAHPVRGFADGFLVTRFEGRPLAHGRPATNALVEKVAAYLSFLRRELPAMGGTEPGVLGEMARENLEEGLHRPWPHSLGSPGVLGSAEPTELDARMLPHEWVRTREGWRKSDATDHHDDHFFPGCTDIAWDVAAACEEIVGEPSRERELVEAVSRATKDGTLARRVVPFRVAYVAHRLAFAELASRSLEAPEGPAWSARATHYRARLRRAIEGTR